MLGKSFRCILSRSFPSPQVGVFYTTKRSITTLRPSIRIGSWILVQSLTLPQWGRLALVGEFAPDDTSRSTLLMWRFPVFFGPSQSVARKTRTGTMSRLTIWRMGVVLLCTLLFLNVFTRPWLTLTINIPYPSSARFYLDSRRLRTSWILPNVLNSEYSLFSGTDPESEVTYLHPRLLHGRLEFVSAFRQ